MRRTVVHRDLIAPDQLLRVVLGTALLAYWLLAAGAGPAAASAFRFWSYWQGASGEWVAASSGADQHPLSDRDVQGWRFGISSDTLTGPPDNTPDFAVLCPTLATAAQADGSVRVAVVIDSGFRGHAPEGEDPPSDLIACVTLPAGATGSEALAEAAEVRVDDDMVCGINGFPATGCATEISADALARAESAAAGERPDPADPLAEAIPAPRQSSSPLPLIAALILAFGMSALALVTRRRSEARRGTADTSAERR
ncbi:MAG: SCO2322 family protein [Candidatus Nanopelagicales bacterium]